MIVCLFKLFLLLSPSLSLSLSLSLSPYLSIYQNRKCTCVNNTFLSRPPGLLNRGPVDPATLGHFPQFSIFSPTGLIPKSQSEA